MGHPETVITRHLSVICGNANLIVVSCGRSGAGSRFPGSAGKELTLHALCSVLTDRPLRVPAVYPVWPMPSGGVPAWNGARRTLEEHALLSAGVPVMGLTATAEAFADGPWSSRADQEEPCP